MSLSSPLFPSALLGKECIFDGDWRFHEFPNASAHALYITCTQLMSLPVPAPTVGSNLIDVILRGWVNHPDWCMTKFNNHNKALWAIVLFPSDTVPFLVEFWALGSMEWVSFSLPSLSLIGRSSSTESSSSSTRLSWHHTNWMWIPSSCLIFPRLTTLWLMFNQHIFWHCLIPSSIMQWSDS